jgi:hypothetical protein
MSSVGVTKHSPWPNRFLEYRESSIDESHEMICNYLFSYNRNNYFIFRSNRLTALVE